MATVLVVDDEKRYRDELGEALSRSGHEVRLAGSGREAIDAGIAWPPDILIADWLLQNHIHGLHVADAIRTVRPDSRTILITGFASRELQEEAERLGLFDFIAKPFSLERIRSAIRHAADRPASAGTSRPVGVFATDDMEQFVYLNETARELLREAGLPTDPKRLDEVLTAETMRTIREPAAEWIVATPVGTPTLQWHVRSRRIPERGVRLLLAIRETQAFAKQYPAVRMLLDIVDNRSRCWPIEGRAILIDDALFVRRAVTSVLDSVGCICHAAENAETTLRLFQHDPDIKVVMIDFSLRTTDVADLIRRIRQIKPDVLMIGTGTFDHSAAFAAMGVKHFLLKPYLVTDVLDLVATTFAQQPAEHA